MTPAEITANAIKRAGEHADPEWSVTAMAALVRIARKGKPFTTDEVWAALAKKDVTTHEHRAMGSIIRTARAAGLIKHTGVYVQTSRPEAHSRPIPKWVLA